MKKIILLGFLIVSLSVDSSFAKPVKSDKALKAAKTFLVVRYPVSDPRLAQTITKKGYSALGVKEVSSLRVSEKLIGYVVDLEPTGFVLFSGDDEMPPVKIYSDTGSYKRLPEGLQRVLELELLEDNTTVTSTSKKSQLVLSKIKRFSDRWNYLTSDENQNNNFEPSLTGEPGTAILTTTWNQNDPYNYYCPVAAGGPGGRALAGCVATAFAQVLRYHMMPTSIASDHSYVDGSGSCQGTHSISDAGMDAYDWANMASAISTSSPEAQKQAVGQLIYHCGVLVNSDYEADSTSGSFGIHTVIALQDYLKYTCDDTQYKSDYTSTEWYSMISTDVYNNQPILYAMWEADMSDGHVAVCDGYRNGNEIHLELGWSGAWTAWYNIDTVIVSGYTWTIHKAIFNIAPILPPNPPSSITYPDTSDTGQYTVSWSSSLGASAYVLQRSNDGGINWLQLFKGPSTSYPENIGNGSYRYQVQAINVGGDSSWMTGTTDCIVSISLPPNADINADNIIDSGDLNILARQWLNPCSLVTEWCSYADLDRSGTVDFQDFARLASQWNSIIIPEDMELIQSGTFEMGDSFYELDNYDERPVHTVTLDSFCISKYLITNEQYCTYLNSDLGSSIYISDGVVYGSGNNQPYFDTSTSSSYAGSFSQIDYSGGIFSVRTKGGRDMSNDPVVCVSWYGAVAYCNWRSQQENWEQCYDLTTWTCDFSKLGFCLPTEAEWEYAARGGLSGKRYPWGDTISRSEANYGGWDYDPIWYDGIPPYTSPVGSYPQNNYGLYDMAGNVHEWCYDWYSSSYYSSSPTDNPTGPASGTFRVRRGGSWYDAYFYCRVASRECSNPTSGRKGTSFRIALNLN